MTFVALLDLKYVKETMREKENPWSSSELASGLIPPPATPGSFTNRLPPDPPDPLSPFFPAFDSQFPSLQTTIASPPLSKKQIALLKGTASVGFGNGKPSATASPTTDNPIGTLDIPVVLSESMDLETNPEITVHNKILSSSPSKPITDSAMTDLIIYSPGSSSELTSPHPTIPPVIFSSLPAESQFVVALAANPPFKRRNTPFKHTSSRKKPTLPSPLSITTLNPFSALDLPDPIPLCSGSSKE
ncbi:hypothetical protein HID58_016562 [Brassica napus]|uniref:Uncharacterized protein n=1 Tax=Brassica napus TaxID=3708 RepID=A0ABQ8DQN9_BRANA|nr:hypothetical protein HID58_016562 [Brassica napus]